MNQWYKGLYRRNLVDMHINDTNDEYLKFFSAEKYFAYLKKAKIQSPMIYLQSHTGLCYYPTKVGKEHIFFSKHPDEVKKLIKLCHDDGMKVVGYYSLLYNNQAVIDHPDWEMRDINGLSWRDNGQRYGLACPNNEEYLKFVEENIKELAQTYPEIDGIFYDQPFWSFVCHCPSCQKKWEDKYHSPLPEKEDWNDPNWRNFQSSREKWIGEFITNVRKISQKIMPDVTVEFNCAAIIGCNWDGGTTELINDESEFTGGDLYGDLYNHSFVAKYYYGITKNQPFEYMTSRCNRSLREHTINKNDITLESEIMLTCMHHGASLMIDAIDPDGCLDERVAEHLGKVFEKQIPYEPYMDKGTLYADVGIFFDSQTQFPNHDMPMNKECVIQANRTIIENHIPLTILGNYHSDNLSRFQMIIIPSLDDFNNPGVDKFIEYVRNGGTLYLSGCTNKKLLKEFFDGEIVGFTNGNSAFKHIYKGYDEVQAYIRPTNDKYKKFFNEFNDKYPLPISYKLPILKHNKGEVMACITLPYTDPDDPNTYASIHSNPPGVNCDDSAVVEVNYGKGKVIYSAAILEKDPRYNFQDIFMNIVKDNVKPLFDVQASKYVESIIFKDGNDYYMNLFDLNFAFDIVDRKVSVDLHDNYQVFEIPALKEVDCKNGKFEINFTKYKSLLLKRK